MHYMHFDAGRVEVVVTSIISIRCIIVGSWYSCWIYAIIAVGHVIGLTASCAFVNDVRVGGMMCLPYQQCLLVRENRLLVIVTMV